MASPRMKLLSTAAIAVLGATGYYLYMAYAAQGQGALAQAPLNIQASIRPAFIMGLDNSGSMSTDETLFRTSNGVGRFRNGSFFDSAGNPWESGGTSYPRVVDEAPRADYYGAARDPEYNRAYFNPASVYVPWRKADGSFEPNSDPAAAVEDPRGSGKGAQNPFTTFDFTSYRTATETWANGTTMPKGTTYYNDTWCNREPGNGSIQNKWITLGQDLTFTQNCTTQFQYYPAVVYLSDAATPPPGYDLSKRVLVKGAGPKGIDLWRYDYIAANFTTGGAAAVQNFANWWTYYGNRNRSMIAAMTNSLGDVTNMRVGYFQINPAPPTGNVAMYDVDVAADKTTLYGKMRNLNASGNTPTRRAVAYMVDQFRRTDTGAPVQLACQKNAGMLFTDGYTNDNNSGLSPLVGDVDHALPPPYGGGVASSNTIADYAMDGYLNNLRSDLPSGLVPVPDECKPPNVPAPGTDCNKNQHMNFYGVTLGARGAVYEVDPAATADPYANPPAWGATGTMNLDPRNVDDIWHASINSRGEFINAQTPTDITDAMRRILALTGAGTTPSGSIALTGSRIGTGSLTVVPEYTAANNSTDWYSKLRAQSVSFDFMTGNVTTTPLWEASAKLPAAGSRNIYVAKTTASIHPTVSSFSTTSVALDDLCDDALATCTKTGTRSIVTKLGIGLPEAVAYLRGDQSLEGSKLRTRTTRLGDVVNSSPLVSAPTDDYGYQSLRGATPGTYDTLNYKAYLTTKKTRTPMVYAGANDGMLHAFDGDTGVEKFAYIPATSLSHMGTLLFPYNAADKQFQVFNHRYYVDGPVNVTDVHDGTSWKTVLVGTSGAGGRSVFALDVSNPGSFGASKVLWELNDRVSNAAIKNNIGSVLGKPVVVPVKDGAGNVKWKAIFGNGYGSINGDAVLFVVDIASGATTTIKAEETGGPAVNGLGNIIALDRYVGTSNIFGSDGYVDTVYGGDQNGAVWKFDLRSGSALNQPFFVATDPSGVRQPILGGFEAAAGPGGGVMLFFGTGSFSFDNDATDKQVQTLYGVLDRFNGSTVAGRNLLLQQDVLSDASGVRELTNFPLGLGKQGWLVDLGVKSGSTVVATGERSVGYPVIASGVVFFPTYDPDTTEDCAANGTNRLYGLNTLSGGRALAQAKVGSPTGTSLGSETGAIKLDTQGSAPVKELAVMTAPRQGGLSAGATPGAVTSALDARCSMVVQAPGAPLMYLPRPCGRQSWRQVR